jgi:hypothetical protein
MAGGRAGAEPSISEAMVFNMNGGSIPAIPADFFSDLLYTSQFCFL